MQAVPRTALWLGLAGLLPMLWGVAEMHLPVIRQLTHDWVGPWFEAPYATLRYAQIILAFMSGVLWGFAARAPAAAAPLGYVLSVIPVLYAFFMLTGGVEAMAAKLAIGFVLVLGIDWMFHAQKLTPEWWLRLRVVLTIGMVICLLALGQPWGG